MILTFGGDFVNFGGSLVGTNSTPTGDYIVIDGVIYDTIKIGDYEWTIKGLKVDVQDTKTFLYSNAHDINYYQRVALNYVASKLPSGWRIPTEEDLAFLMSIGESYPLQLYGYRILKDDGGESKKLYDGERYYYTGIENWLYFYKDGSTPTLAISYGSHPDYAFPLIVCKKVV